jgi:hypothetical protein
MAYHCDEIDLELALAELLLKLGVGVSGHSFGQDLKSFLEVVDVTLVASLLEQLPCLIFRLFEDVLVVQEFSVLTVMRKVTLLTTIVALAGWAVITHVT